MTDKCSDIFNILSDYLKNYQNLDTSILENIEARKNGKTFNIKEHIKGMIFSLLSNQRKWGTIYQNKKVIEEIFFYFDKNKLKKLITTILLKS